MSEYLINDHPLPKFLSAFSLSASLALCILEVRALCVVDAPPVVGHLLGRRHHRLLLAEETLERVPLATPARHVRFDP